MCTVKLFLSNFSLFHLVVSLACGQLRRVHDLEFIACMNVWACKNHSTSCGSNPLAPSIPIMGAPCTPFQVLAMVIACFKADKNHRMGQVARHLRPPQQQFGKANPCKLVSSVSSRNNVGAAYPSFGYARTDSSKNDFLP